MGKNLQNQLREELVNNCNLFPKIIGKDDTKLQLRSALVLGRHVILVGPPGVGKTTLAKSIAELLPKKKEDRFVRIQGSPDLTVEDLIGDIDPIKALKFGPLSKEAFTPGKIFRADGGILFFDEVNRCPEKLQNALLQVLEEGKATLGGYSFDMPADFIFIATMNPEDTSTEKLSDVFLDRFDMIHVTYPETHELEEKIVKSREQNLGIKFPEKLFMFSIGFVRLLRNSQDVEKKPGVRASIGLVERAKAYALLNKRDMVIFDDIKQSVVSVLGHRVRLKPSMKFLKSPTEFITDSFKAFSDQNPDFDDVKEGDVP